MSKNIDPSEIKLPLNPKTKSRHRTRMLMLKSCSVNDYFQNAPAAPWTFDMYLCGCGPLLVRGPQFENHLLRTPATVKVLFLTCFFWFWIWSWHGFINNYTHFQLYPVGLSVNFIPGVIYTSGIERFIKSSPEIYAGIFQTRVKLIQPRTTLGGTPSRHTGCLYLGVSISQPKLSFSIAA